MEQNFPTMFENVRHERSLPLLMSLTDPDILRQNNITEYEFHIIKNLASEKLHRQRILKEHVAMSFLESGLE